MPAQGWPAVGHRSSDPLPSHLNRQVLNIPLDRLRDKDGIHLFFVRSGWSGTKPLGTLNMPPVRACMVMAVRPL